MPRLQSIDIELSEPLLPEVERMSIMHISVPTFCVLPSKSSNLTSSLVFVKFSTLLLQGRCIRFLFSAWGHELNCELPKKMFVLVKFESELFQLQITHP